MVVEADVVEDAKIPGAKLSGSDRVVLQRLAVCCRLIGLVGQFVNDRVDDDLLVPLSERLEVIASVRRELDSERHLSLSNRLETRVMRARGEFRRLRSPCSSAHWASRTLRHSS